MIFNGRPLLKLLSARYEKLMEWQKSSWRRVNVPRRDCIFGLRLDWVEVMESNESLPDGASGDLVCTGLLNVDMPLIRYKVGDRGSITAGLESCSCGRTLPEISRIEGRSE